MLSSIVLATSSLVAPRLGASASHGALSIIAPPQLAARGARGALATMAAPEWPDERDDLRALFRKHVEERMPLPHAPDGLAHKFLSVTKIGLGLYLASYVVLPFILLAQAAVFGSFVFVYLWWVLGQLGRAVSAAARRLAGAEPPLSEAFAVQYRSTMLQSSYGRAAAA